MRETLQKLYEDKQSLLCNEFQGDESIRGKRWRFQNYNPKEFVWHQQRKMIYALFNDEKSGRSIKAEFEPVKDWREIGDAHFSEKRIVQKGWVKMFAQIAEDQDAAFIPSVYGIKPLKVLSGVKDAYEVTRVVSYMEEFRMQAKKGEEVYVEGNLEQVTTPNGNFYQITLTYCPRYYAQVLKVVSA
jgi:predicted nucleotidyltransferase